MPGALRFAGELEERLPEEDEPGTLTLDVLWQMSGELNNIVQLSAPSPLVADDASAALDVVFDEMVVDPAARRFRFKKKHSAVKSTRQAYRQHAVPDEAVKQRVRVESGQFAAQFDFAIHNGRAVQLVNCWSFQLPNQQELAEQVKAWAWVVHELRERGGIVRAGDVVVEADSGLEVAAVYVPPSEDEVAPAFDEATAAFAEVNVEAFTQADADILGERAALALGVAA